MYVGAGTFAEAQARVPAEIVNLLAGLDPDDHKSRAALLSLRELLGRYAADPDIGQAIVEELGGTGMAEVFDALTVEPPAADASAELGEPVVGWPLLHATAGHDAAPGRQDRQPGRHTG